MQSRAPVARAGVSRRSAVRVVRRGLGPNVDFAAAAPGAALRSQRATRQPDFGDPTYLVLELQVGHLPAEPHSKHATRTHPGCKHGRCMLLMRWGRAEIVPGVEGRGVGSCAAWSQLTQSAGPAACQRNVSQQTRIAGQVASTPANVAEARTWIGAWKNKKVKSRTQGEVCSAHASARTPCGHTHEGVECGRRCAPWWPIPRFACAQAASANRASWFPGTTLPDHLDGSLAGE